MTATQFFWAVPAALTAVILLGLGAVALILFICWLLVFVQQWRGRSRWCQNAQDMRVRQRRDMQMMDHRYDPRLFRRRG